MAAGRDGEQLDLAALRGQRPAIETRKSDVARFKEEDAEPRICCDSTEYIVYSLKGRVSLRVLPRKTTDQLVFKQHTAQVLSAQFVHHQSNMVASRSANELLVWIIDGVAKDTVVLFAIKEQISACAWVASAQQQPQGVAAADLLVLHGATASLVRAAEVIQQRLPVATAAFFDMLPARIAVDAPLCAGAEGFFAFTSDAVTIVSGTRTAKATWQPCGNSAVTMLAVSRGGVVTAACKSHVAVWDAASPVSRRQLFKLVPSPNAQPLCALGAASAFVTLFFAGATEAAVLSLASGLVSFHKLHGTVRPGGFHLSPVEDGVSLLADIGLTLTHHFLLPPQPAAQSPAQAQAPAPAPAPKQPAVAAGGEGLSGPLKKLLASSPAGVVPQGQQQGQQGQQGQPRNGLAPPPPLPSQHAAGLVSGGAQFTVPSLPPMTGINQHLVKNTALAGGTDRAVAATVDKASAEIDALRSQLDLCIQNTSRILRVCGTSLNRDHEALTKAALDAQRETIQRGFEVATRNGVLGGGGGGGASGASEDDLMYLMQRLTACVTAGVGPAIERSVAQQLEPALRAAVAKQGVKDVRADLKQRLDAALSNAGNDFGATLDARAKPGQAQLVWFLEQIGQTHTETVQALQAIIQQQQEQLAAYQAAGIVQEIEALRKTVKALIKEANGESHVAAAVAPSPETIVSTARQFIDGKDHARGLDWVARFKNPDLTATLLAQLTAEQREAIVEDAAIPDELLATAVAHLSATSDATKLATSLVWLEGILLGRESLLQNTAVVKTVKDFIALWSSVADLPVGLKKDLKRLASFTK